MATKQVSIDDNDIKVYDNITKSMTSIEGRIAALEIAKSNLLDDYKGLQERYSEFAQVITKKYNIPTTEATIDIDKKIIEYDDETVPAS